MSTIVCLACLFLLLSFCGPVWRKQNASFTQGIDVVSMISIPSPLPVRVHFSNSSPDQILQS